MERSVHLPVAAQPDVETVVGFARSSEREGYDRVWLPETWGRDAVTILATIAHSTDEIGIGSSVLPIYSRSPALLGQTAATLQEVSTGRFRLGIGPSGPAVIEGWHGVEFDRPLRRTRETVEIVRNVLSGETVNYDGDSFTLAGLRLRCDSPEEPVPIDVAAMGPKAVELAGRFADGWHGIVLTPEGIEERLKDLARGAEPRNRDPEDVRVTISVTACALEDGERARELARRHMAFYLGAMGTYYRDSLARQGHGDVAEAVAAAWASGDREEALSLISEDLLDELCAAGRPERARDLLERFAAIDGVDDVAVGFPRGATEAEIEATIEALAP
ncbi:TIGR04024 family LLM class F420-dependent oxidoreductase [Saliphagus infecundisoli]|uniref:TIGR04024 family LLM class F420-dependent oxidoreductase n=1 Tax=Saliphagus infecundisoli TaxID=1849069 RepID=A0ABD5QHZ3_9EURY|nr:TIGR04024 family LLM class F420-dependent oxidoreductase [Saliphagus infecundisoli]